MVATRHTLGRALSSSSTGLYICRTCRDQLSRVGISTQHQRFASSQNLPATERVRRKIWGNDDRPRLKDFYGGTALFERRRAQQLSRHLTTNPDHTKLRQSSGDSSATVSDQAAQNPSVQAANDHQEEYTPAETWDGLRYIGSTGSWHDVPAQPTDEFSAWLGTVGNPATNPDQLLSCLHQAFVECLTCIQAGLQPESIFHLNTAEFRDDLLETFATAKITVEDSGRLGQVQFASEDQARVVVEMLASVDSALQTQPSETIGASEGDPDMIPETMVEATEAYNTQNDSQTILQSQGAALHYIVEDKSFLGVKLDMEDPFSFVVLKRFSQLSGHQLPDPLLNSLFTNQSPLSSLVSGLDKMVVRPKPEKVADALLSRPDLSSQGNVMVFPRRETPVDKEKEVGRWKVIEKELQLRGLPVLGKIKA